MDIELNNNRMYRTLTSSAKLRGEVSSLPSKMHTDTNYAPPSAGSMLISVPGIGSNLRILLQGWLYKRGPFYQPWRLRWCVVAKREDSFRLKDRTTPKSDIEDSHHENKNSAVLVIYSQRDHANGLTPPKGVIVLAVQLEVQVPNNSIRKTILDRNILFPFVFVVQGRRHVFASSKRIDREDWIHLVQSISESPFTVPRPVSSISDMEDGSVLSSDSLADRSSMVGSAMNPTEKSKENPRESSFYSQLGFSMKADALSLADMDVLTATELSEVGQRPSSLRPATHTNIHSIIQSGPNSPQLIEPNHPWNEVYQRLCDQPCESHQAEVQRDLAMAELLGQFNEVAKTLVVQIIDGYHTRSHPITNKETESWIFGNILVSLAADYTLDDKVRIATAVRRASHELRGTSVLSSIESELHTPLMCLVDYKGFRLVCSASVPLSPDETLVLDTSKGKADVSALEKLSEAYAHLNLAEPPKQAVPSLTQGNSSVNVHYAHSHDHYYVTCLSEMFPVDYPKPERPIDPSRRLRPEFVAKYKHALSSSAVYFKTNETDLKKQDPELAEARKDVIYAARYLRDNHIMNFVTKLDRLELLPCDSFGLSECLHNHGINIRYLGLVATRTRLPAIKEQCLIEMVGRASKDVFQSRIRSCILNFRRIGATKIDSELSQVTVEMLNLILVGDEKTWEESIKPVLQQKFSFVMSHEIFRALHRPAMIRSIQYHWSIEIEELDLQDKSFNHQPMTINDFRGFCAKPKVIMPKRNGRKHLTTLEDRALFDLSQHLSLCGPQSKLVACSVTQRRLIAVARASLLCGRPSDAVKYATAATHAGPWKKSCGTARAWAVLAEVAWVINPGNEDTESKSADLVSNETKKPIIKDPSLNRNNKLQSTKADGSCETLVASRMPSSAALTTAAAVAGLRPISELTRNAIDAVTVHWGLDHPLVIDIHSRLAKSAQVYSPNKALDHHARSLRASIRSLGRTHPVTARVQLSACVQLVMQGRAQEAARMGQDALASLDGNNTDNDMYTLERALAYSVLAEAQGVLGDLESARKYASKCRSLRERKLGWSHPLTADACAQVATLAVQSASLPEYHDAEIITTAARADILAAIEAYGRVFKFLKTKTAGSADKYRSSITIFSHSSAPNEKEGTDLSSSGPETAPEQLDDFTPLSWMMPSEASNTFSDQSLSDTQSTNVALLRLPSIISPAGQPINTSLLKLAKTLIGLKLRVLSPNHNQHIRIARRRPHIGMTEEVMRDIMARLVGLTPAVFLDDCLGRADEGDTEAIDELSIVIALSEK